MKDLFAFHELLPNEVQILIDKFSLSEGSYKDCQVLVESLNLLGYTCAYGLDAEPYGLTKLQTIKTI
jgi:hypothetical protein